MKERHKVIPSGYIIPYKKGKILLSRRQNTGYMDGYYGLAAGHGETGETFVECALREAKEEIGITTKIKDLKFVHLMHRLVDSERVDAFYICKKWTGKIENMEPDKCASLEWFPIRKLPKNIIPYVKQAIVEGILKKKSYSDFVDRKKWKKK